MARSIDEIHDLWRERVNRLGPVHARMTEVRDVVNGDVVLPLPEMDRSARPAVANILKLGLDQKAERIASTMPDIYYPPLRVGIQKSEENARTRRLVNLAWWEGNGMKIKMSKRARHLTAYAMSPVLMRPDFKNDMPQWQLRDPITTYAPQLDAGELVPEDCIFAYSRPLNWLKARYPAQAAQLYQKQHQSHPDAHYRILEYVDADELVLLAIYVQPNSELTPYAMPFPDDPQASMIVELERVPNRTGRPLAIVPGRISLDRMQGEFDGVVGMYQELARLFALEVIGMQRTVWPETWLVSNQPGVTPHIVNMADPLAGEVGVVEGGTLDRVTPTPSPFGTQIADRLERYIRVEGTVPPEFGGEAGSNIRTGRRGDAVLSNAIDFGIQATQRLFEASMEEENKAAVAIDKAFFKRSKSFPLSATGGRVAYTTDVWESDTNYVKYSMAGVDLQGLIVSGAQRIGTGTLSKRTFMETDPMVEDVDGEMDEIAAEAMQAALLQAIQTRAAQDPTFVAPVAEMIAEIQQGKVTDLAAVYMRVDQKYQEQQQAQQQGMQGPQQPGLAQPQAAIGPPPKSMQNLTDLLTQLKSGQQAGQPFQPQEG